MQLPLQALTTQFQISALRVVKSWCSFADSWNSGEVIHISSLALLKVCVIVRGAFAFRSSSRRVNFQMLKHGRAGVPMEVMGLMLGEFVDE